MAELAPLTPGWLAEARACALENVVAARKAMQRSREEYRKALARAKELDISNGKIAREVGVSETAIRNFMKRHPSE